MVSLQSRDFNHHLRELAQAAKQHPPRSRQRQLVLHQLITAIWRSSELGNPQRGFWSEDVYEDFYNEALQRTLLEVCQKIDAYNPHYPVMAWVNFLLKCHFFKVVKDYRNCQVLTVSLSELDSFVALDSSPNEAQRLREFLEADPENLLSSVHVKNHPEITFQFLAIARFVHDHSWEHLSAKLGVSLQTLCSFFNRQLRKFQPYFQKYLQE